MPEAFVSIASRVVTLDVDIDLALAFADGCHLEFYAKATGGCACLPELGGIVPRYATLHGPARIWWDTQTGKVLVAFLRGSLPEVNWDIERLRVACCAVPDAVEEALMPQIVSYLCRRYTVDHPLSFSLGHDKAPTPDVASASATGTDAKIDRVTP